MKNAFLKAIKIKLPKEFYKGQTRSGYFVCEKMKKVWAVELDLLKTFSEVCDKNGLRYFLDGGTLLGAVRHKGFIPWDDDVDVAMPRADYDALLQIADKSFSFPYFLQTSYNAKGLFRSHAQLRNSRTTGFIESDAKRQINKGIFLDVFVLDNLPDGVFAKKIFKRAVLTFRQFLRFAYDDTDFRLVAKRWLLPYFFSKPIFKIFGFKKIFAFYEKKILSAFKSKNTKMFGDLALRWREYVHFERGWFEDFCNVEFEGFQFKAPANFHAVLKRHYGNYMEVPKDIFAKNFREHGKTIFEPDVPYEEYFERIGEEE